MANIQGVSLKKIEKINNGYKANIFIGRNKVGNVRNYGNDEDFIIDIEPEFKQDFIDRMNSYYAIYNVQYRSKEIFITKVYELIEMENLYNKETEFVHKNFDTPYPCVYIVPLYNEEKLIDVHVTYDNKKINEIVNNNPNTSYKIFTTPRDFKR